MIENILQVLAGAFGGIFIAVITLWYKWRRDGADRQLVLRGDLQKMEDRLWKRVQGELDRTSAERDKALEERDRSNEERDRALAEKRKLEEALHHATSARE
jgi:hypothetical protein